MTRSADIDRVITLVFDDIPRQGIGLAMQVNDCTDNSMVARQRTASVRVMKGPRHEGYRAGQRLLTSLAIVVCLGVSTTAHRLGSETTTN